MLKFYGCVHVSQAPKLIDKKNNVDSTHEGRLQCFFFLHSKLSRPTSSLKPAVTFSASELILLTGRLLMSTLLLLNLAFRPDLSASASLNKKQNKVIKTTRCGREYGRCDEKVIVRGTLEWRKRLYRDVPYTYINRQSNALFEVYKTSWLQIINNMVTN